MKFRINALYNWIFHEVLISIWAKAGHPHPEQLSDENDKKMTRKCSNE
jgi:hypothetical protein